MKKLILIVFAVFLLSIKAKAGDSTIVALSIQTRDIEYLAGYLYNSEDVENLKDSVVVAYRKLNNPLFSTPVEVKGYTKDFIQMAKFLRNDIISKANNADSRLITLLAALNDSYINAILQQFVVNDNNAYVAGKKYGKYRLTRIK